MQRVIWYLISWTLFEPKKRKKFPLQENDKSESRFDTIKSIWNWTVFSRKILKCMSSPILELKTSKKIKLKKILFRARQINFWVQGRLRFLISYGWFSGRSICKQLLGPRVGSKNQFGVPPLDFQTHLSSFLDLQQRKCKSKMVKKFKFSTKQTSRLGNQPFVDKQLRVFCKT